MSIEVYESKETEERIKNLNSFAGTTPIDMEINDDMGRATLAQLAKRLLKEKYSQTDGVVGIQLNFISFTPILDPEKFDNFG